MSVNIFSILWSGLSILLLVFSINGCDTSYKPTDESELKLSNTNYSVINNWVRFTADTIRDVDIFAVYPTLNSSDAADKPYVRLDNPQMREMAEAWLEEVKGLFPENTNIYMPLYRQLNGAEIVELPNMSYADFAAAVNLTPREDIFAAFDYYLTHINNGRPFILIGISQGAQLVKELATTLLGHEKYSKYNDRHIITYVCGIPVIRSDVAKNLNLKFSQNKDDIGVIVSWNSTAPSEVNNNKYKTFTTYLSGAIVTNPIRWTTDETPATTAENGASRVSVGTVSGDVEFIFNYADAIVDNARGILRVTTVNEEGYSTILPDKTSIFHNFNIDFFYESIMLNIRNRIEAYKINHQKSN